MTNLEALTAAVQVPGIDANTLEKACIDADLTSGDAYAKTAEKAVDLAAVSVLRSLVVTSESEGGFSYNVSAEALKQRIAYLQSKWGVTETGSSQPLVRNASDRW